MGRTGKVLNQVLKAHGISQNKLAVASEVKVFLIYRWFHEKTDSTTDSIADIAKALPGINLAAAEEFVRL